MNIEKLVAVFVRIFAVALGIYLAFMAISWIPFLMMEPFNKTGYFVLLACFIALLIAIYCWVFPNVVARKLISAESHDEVKMTAITAEELQIVAFTTLGLFLLYDVLAEITYWSLRYYRASLVDNPYQGMNERSNFPEMLAFIIVKVVFVITLLFGRKGITKLLLKIRQ